MNKIIRFIYTDLFLRPRFFISAGLAAFLFLLSFFLPWLGFIPYLYGLTWFVILLSDLFLLYGSRGEKVTCSRSTPAKLSNGDENALILHCHNRYRFPIKLDIIDEIPMQFQQRDTWFSLGLAAGEKKDQAYTLRPLKRGLYSFGKIRLFVCSPIGLVQRRFNMEAHKDIPVYPSFLQMRRYEMMAISNRLSDYGLKKIRRIGQSMEFDQVKNYVQGDDYRTLNWKASARHANLMVNAYVDEKSQHIYCIIDKSRTMKMPFNGLSLLDYAINATLVLSNIALKKEDKAGLITISEKIGTVVPADRKTTQLRFIMEALYKEKTRYLEVNMEALYVRIRHTLKQRSLVILFSNFESISALNRQLPFLKRIAKYHLLVVVFFENTELGKLSTQAVTDLKGIYVKTIAEKFIYEKQLIMKELNRHGIQAVLTSPEALTVNTINKYLEIKARQAL